MIIQNLMPVVLLAVLIVASLFDLLNDMTIPLPIGIIGIGIRMIEMVLLEPNRIKECIITAILLFALFMVSALMGAYGGADVMYASMIGLYLGIHGVYAVMLSFVFSLPYALYMKKKEKQSESEKMAYPFVPYLLLATSIIVVYF